MPKSVPKLTKESEAKLVKALRILTKEAAAGKDPGDVSYRLIKDKTIPLCHASYLVYAYNNGIVLDQIKNSNSAKEKCAEVKVIKLDHLLKRLGIRMEDMPASAGYSQRTIDKIYEMARK